MQKKDFRSISLLAVIVILGFLSGVAGELWVNSFLLPDPYLNFKSYNDLSKKIDDLLNEGRSKKELTLDDQQSVAAIEKSRPTLVQIFAYKKFSDANKFETSLASEVLGLGTVITNDGWIVTTDVVVPAEINSGFVVTNDRTIFKIENVLRDATLGVVYLKISGNNLPVAEFALKSTLMQGQNLLVYNNEYGVESASVGKINYSTLNVLADYTHSSEIFYQYILLDKKVMKNSGSPVFNLRGQMVGVMSANSGVVMPIDYLALSMKNLGKSDVVEASSLGVKFQDLSEVLNPKNIYKKGALIASLNADSPAKDLLLAGDIIVKVENEELNYQKTLSELVSQYRAGDSIKLSIIRSGNLQEITVPLAKREIILKAMKK